MKEGIVDKPEPLLMFHYLLEMHNDDRMKEGE